MKTILDRIIENKRLEVEANKAIIGLNRLKQSPLFKRTCHNFGSFILNKSGVIAEFKRKSPSKGIINSDALVANVVKGYENAGVSAISVLTDTTFFGGTNNDLLISRELVNIPILRKDFIIDTFQIMEAKALGADVILLIAACLSVKECNNLAAFAKDLGLNVFLELHTEAELDHINKDVDVVGINNRNLKTFEVDIQNSLRLSSLLPADMVKVAESGINNPEIIKTFKDGGFRGFLIGESFMKTDNPELACSNFIKTING